MKSQSSQRLSLNFTITMLWARKDYDDHNRPRNLGSIVRIIDGKLVRVAHVFSHHPPEYLSK